jgi:hypothetical protein
MLTALIERPGRLVYLSSGLHRGGEGSLADLDWTKRPWDPARAYAESAKLGEMTGVALPEA